MYMICFNLSKHMVITILLTYSFHLSSMLGIKTTMTLINIILLRCTNCKQSENYLRYFNKPKVNVYYI